MENIPAFKNTEHALSYGHENRENPAIIQALQAERARLLVQVRELMEAGRDGEALFLASGQCQLCREALEGAGLKG